MAVLPGFQTEKWLLFSWDLAQKKEDVRTSLSVRQSLVESCQKFNEKSPNGPSESRVRWYDDDNTCRSRNRKSPRANQAGGSIPLASGSSGRGCKGSREHKKPAKSAEKVWRTGNTVRHHSTKRETGAGRGAGRPVPTITKGGSRAHHHQGGDPGYTTTKGGDGSEGGSSAQGTDTTTTKGNTPTWTQKR